MVEKKGASWPALALAYSLDNVIGQGSFGLVWRATCLDGEHKGA